MKKYGKEKLIKYTLLIFSSISVLTTVLLILNLTFESLPFFKEVKITELIFNSGKESNFIWNPRQGFYSILPLLKGSVLIMLYSCLVSIPLGLGSAIYLSEYASPKSRSILKPVLEILAGIPSVVYGFFAITTITPFLKNFFPAIDTFNVLAASIAVGIMSTPLVASISEDALRSVPKALREGSLGLGATKFETVYKVTIPAALSGIIASFILAISRALGETMIVAMAAGSNPNVKGFSPLKQVQTMTGYMVNKSQGELERGSLEYRTIFVVGLILFLMTLLLNLVAKKVVLKYREVY